MQRLPRTFYRRDARVVARDLLGRIIVTAFDGIRTAGRIVETEAYLGAEDLASHASRGPTRRNEPMFLGGGHAYIYFIYGMHHCFNIVTGERGSGEAVLLRAIEPTEGIELMLERRGPAVRNRRHIADGPGKLAVALGIGPELNGVDLTTNPRIWIEPGTPVDDSHVTTTPRIGITKGLEHDWRYVVGRESGS